MLPYSPSFSLPRLIFFAFYLVAPWSLMAQTIQQQLDSVLMLAPEGEQLRGLHALLVQYERTQPDSAIRAGELALPLAERLGDSSLLEKVHYHLATSYYYAKDNDSVEPHIDRAITIARARGDAPALARSYHRLLTYYRTRVGLSEALDTALLLYDQAVSEQPVVVQAAVITALCRIYQDLRSEKTFECIHTGVKLARESGDTNVMILALNQAASTLYYVDSTERALQFANEAISLATAAKPSLLEHLYNLRGLIHGARGNAALAIADFDRRLEAIQSPPDLFYFANIGQLFWQSGELDSALVNYDRAAELLTAADPVDYAKLFELRRIQVQAALSRLNDRSVFEYWDLYSTAMDSLRGRELEQRAQEFEMRFETERREAMIDRQESIMSRQRIQLYALGGILLLAITTGIILYTLTRRLRRRNEENKQLVTQREALVSEVYHRVKNNLQVIASLLALQSEQLGDGAAIDALRASQSRVEAMGLIHERLYGHQNLTSIGMADYLEDLSSRLLTAYSIGERVDLYTDVEALHLDVDTAMIIGLLVSELITNSLKHAFPDDRHGTVEISLYQKESKLLVLEVGDDGVGQQVTTATRGGFGSQLIQLLTDRFKGQLTHPAPEPTGYRTRITFVYHKNALRGIAT